MMFKSLVAGLLTLGALVASPAFAQAAKIGVVDYGRLMQDSPQAKTAIDAIRAEFAPKERDLQTQGTTLKAREEKLQKDAATMTADQRTKLEKELRDGLRDLERKRQEIQDDFNARRNEVMSQLQRTLIEEVRTYAKAQNFDLVLADGVIFAAPALDITAAVLSGLKTRGPAAAPAPAAKPQGK